MKIERSIDKITQDLLQENEMKANRTMCMAALILAAVYPVTWIISFWGYQSDYVVPSSVSYGIAVIILLILFFIGKKKNYEGEWMKTVLMVGVTIALSPIIIMNVYNAWYLAILPILLACRYFDASFLIVTAIVSTVVTISSQIIGAYVGFATGYYDIAGLAVLPENAEITVHGTLAQTLIDEGYVTLRDLVLFPIGYMPPQIIILACFTAAGFAIV